MTTQTINRDDLKKIHDVACSGWKTKIEDYAKRNPFQENIELSQAEIDEMFKASDSKQKSVLAKFFKQPLDIRSKIKSFKDACEALGLNPKYVTSSDDTKDERGYKRLKVIVKALNEGWYPNWENELEYKYYNYFKMKGGFSYWNTNNYGTITLVPSALCLKSNDLALHCFEIAKEEYKEYYS